MGVALLAILNAVRLQKDGLGVTKNRYETSHKNMVCPRCLSSVRTLLNELEIMVYTSIELGTVVLDRDISKDQQKEFFLRDSNF